ncbi:PiggyBac transposase Uribo1 [Elysia marginata]|uniref:PiggyBac transposase Uribo1 n=1 Tax=Elysia marginata TaxID=1093978 RepID=A0AAV4JGL7_9GAST|nr:PiggyBac transposase Uribo1 [Elysia marginata]
MYWYALIFNSFEVHTGKEADQDHGLAHRVVKDLLQPHHYTGLRVYMDNFYTGVPLLRDLTSVGICACGTVRSNSKFLPTELLPKRVQLEKHEQKSAQADGLTFVVWQDTKPVCVLFNFHDPSHHGTVLRRSGREEQQQVDITCGCKSK